MALKATICKASLQITDLDRQYYASHNLTLARHPSENDERMMVRIAAFALFADEQLRFTKGLSTDDEPELWQKSLSDVIERWIELGQPDEKRLRKACGRADHVVVITYSGSSAEIWWQQNQDAYDRFSNLSVLAFPAEPVKLLAQLASRNMELTATVQDGTVWLANAESAVELPITQWKTAR